ncbi:MAG: type II toxin-antitoxin system Phd/YefM family antitoxin [Acidobacteriota bacterium]|nr:type II toxin-antitoxin system Phd/YefM family antitoxin [Acidobacteriota bacterium]
MEKTTTIPASAFKTRCLELMDRVRETRETYVITKHGNPVARLVACDTASGDRPFVGSMAGTILKYERPFDPIPGEWFTDSGLEPAPRRRLARKKR